MSIFSVGFLETLMLKHPVYLASSPLTQSVLYHAVNYTSK